MNFVVGIDLAYEYLEKKKIPHKKVGKLIVATDQSEVGKLHVTQFSYMNCIDIQ